jgi:hypothetical protein
MRSLPLLLSAVLGLSRKRVALSVVVIDAFVTGLAPVKRALVVPV